MSKSTEKEIKLDVGLPQNGFPKTLYFNRLRVDREEGFCLVQFGLVVASDLVDSYSCVLSDEVLKHNQQALLEYVGKLGTAEVDATVWKGVTASRKADVADIVMMSFRGNQSETALYVFSACAASRAVLTPTTGVSLPSQPLVLLRSSTALQKHLITVLYEGV
jgi:hypothetical protein